MLASKLLPLVLMLELGAAGLLYFGGRPCRVRALTEADFPPAADVSLLEPRSLAAHARQQL